ncbi:MAG: hypothetical protein M3530_04375 [Thermoproteota archaeon]|nr:hypothetical protein [Thermoproteota archaeon]
MKKFSDIHSDLLYNLRYHRQELEKDLAKSPNVVYQQINQISTFVGSRFQISLQLHFPNSSKIRDVHSYGTENIGIVVDKFRKTFPISREIVKQSAKEILGDIKALDAYMYEGKEGLKIIMDSGRIEILPGSVHLWCNIDENVTRFVDWLMDEIYFRESNNPR